MRELTKTMRQQPKDIEEFLPILKKCTGFLPREIKSLITFKDIEEYQSMTEQAYKMRSDRLIEECNDKQKEQYYELIRNLFSRSGSVGNPTGMVQSNFYDQGLFYKSNNGTFLYPISDLVKGALFERYYEALEIDLKPVESEEVFISSANIKNLIFYHRTLVLGVFFWKIGIN